MTSLITNDRVISWYFVYQREICLKLINAVIDDIAFKRDLLEKLNKEGAKQQRKDIIQHNIEDSQNRLRLYLSRLRTLDPKTLRTVNPSKRVPQKGEFRQGVYVAGIDDGHDMNL